MPCLAKCLAKNNHLNMNISFDHKNPVSIQRPSQRESHSTKVFPSRTIVHAKLEMTEPGDHDEQEAEAMAEAVVRSGKISRQISTGAGGSSGISLSPQMESRLAHLQGGGQPMPEGLMNMMERGFGQDFGHVRIHTDAEAAEMSSIINARAFTLGNDIYFNQGQFSPNTTEGQRLVAHELTHVVQGTGKVGRTPQAIESEEQGSSISAGDVAETILYISNLCNDIYSAFQSLKSYKEIYQLGKLFKELKVVADTELGIMRSTKDIIKATAEHRNIEATKLSRIVGWGGVALALIDYGLTFKSLDFENNPVASSSVIALKTANLASVIISQPTILAKVAAASPQTAALFFAFGAGCAIGDTINLVSEKVFGKAPGVALVDYIMNDDLSKVTKDDVLNYFNFAKSRIAYELYNEYNQLDDHKKEYVTIINSSQNGGNYKFHAFMLDYQKSLKEKNGKRFLKNCFVYSSTTSFPAGESRINNLDIFILKKAFQRVGLY